MGSPLTSFSVSSVESVLSPSGFGRSWSSSRSSSEDDEPKFYNGKRNLSFTWGREPYRFRTDYWIKVKGTRLVFRHLQKVSIPMFVLLQLVHKLAEICFRNQVKLWGVDRLITIILSKSLREEFELFCYSYSFLMQFIPIMFCVSLLCLSNHL